jgi:hypothetical protein
LAPPIWLIVLPAKGGYLAVGCFARIPIVAAMRPGKPNGGRDSGWGPQARCGGRLSGRADRLRLGRRLRQVLVVDVRGITPWRASSPAAAPSPTPVRLGVDCSCRRPTGLAPPAHTSAVAGPAAAREAPTGRLPQRWRVPRPAWLNPINVRYSRLLSVTFPTFMRGRR